MVSVDLPPHAAAWLDLLQQARQTEKQARADADLAKRNLLTLLDGADEGHLRGAPVVTRKTITRQIVNSEQLRSEYPQVWEACLRVTETETLKVIT